MFRFLLMVAVCGLAVRSFALGLIIIPEQNGWRPPIIIEPPPRPPWPRPMPPVRPHAFAPLELTSATVTTQIRDQVATTSIEQEFYNPNPARLEGTFIFPVPRGAQLDRFRMEIDGKLTDAELLPAEKARGIYEKIVREMRDPALLEYAGQDVFKVRIFPIEPNSRKRVAFSYTQVLKADAGLASYTLPLGAQKFSSKPVGKVRVQVSLDTTRPLKAVYSPSHEVKVRNEGERRATAIYEATEVAADAADFALYFSTDTSAVGLSLLTHRVAGEPGYFLLLASPGSGGGDAKVLPKDVAFVLDTSGSMAGAKIEQARKALEFCVNSLGEQDRFEIVRFASEDEPLFRELVPANAANRAKAGRFIAGLRATGGTAIDDALKRALALRPAQSGRPFVVIFLTDGRPTVGVTDENAIVDRVKREAGSTRVFVFGLGTDLNAHLLDRIAESSRAFAQYVLPNEDIEVKVSRFFEKIRDPVLANPTLAVSGGVQVKQLYPTPLPDLFRGDQVVLVGRYTGEGDAAITIQGEVQGAAHKFTEETKFPTASEANDFLPRLWATRRVGWLLDEIRLRGESTELKDEVTDLARTHGIVTPYTAYLIVEDEARRGVSANAQTLPQLQADAPARKMAAESYAGMFDKSGTVAVDSARDSLQMRTAATPSAAAGAAKDTLTRRYGLRAPGGTSTAPANPAPEAAERVVQYTQQQRSVAGRTFFQNGNRWVDSLVQRQPAQSKRVAVTFGSIEYFDLLRRHPETSGWLALGDHVDFLLDGVIYQINAAPVK